MPFCQAIVSKKWFCHEMREINNKPNLRMTSRHSCNFSIAVRIRMSKISW